MSCTGFAVAVRCMFGVCYPRAYRECRSSVSVLRVDADYLRAMGATASVVTVQLVPRSRKNSDLK